MSTFVTIPVARVRRFKDQPRRHFGRVALQELADSIKAVGQIVPAVVRAVDDGDKDHDYELIDGERRWRACSLAGVATLKAVVDTDDKALQFRKSVAANFAREDHTPLEIAEAIKVLRESGMTQGQIGNIFGKSGAWIGRYETLNNLAPDVAKLLDPETPEEKRLNPSQAIVIASLPHDLQRKVSKLAVKNGLGVFEIHRLVRQKAKEAGIQLKTRTISPSDDAAVLMTFLRRSSSDLERFMDLPRSRFVEILAGRDRDSRQALIERLEDVAGNFAVLAETVGETARQMNAAALRKQTGGGGGRSLRSRSA